MKFTVILEIRRNGAACGSTRDEIFADTPEQAERVAIALWEIANNEPGYTFAPLVTSAS